MPDLSAFEWIGWIFVSAGSFFCITGAIGILRLPDVFSRMHGAGIIDPLGAALILIGLMFQTSAWIVIAKLVLIIVFTTFTSPTTTFALARAAVLGGANSGPKHKTNTAKDAKP